MVGSKYDLESQQMAKKKKTARKLGKKRNLTIRDEFWEPFVSFTKSLEFRTGSRVVNVTNSRSAEGAFKLWTLLSVDTARGVVFDKLDDEEWWSSVGEKIRQLLSQ